MLSHLRQSFTDTSKAIMSYVFPSDFYFLFKLSCFSQTFIILVALLQRLECNVHNRTLWTSRASTVLKKVE